MPANRRWPALPPAGACPRSSGFPRPARASLRAARTKVAGLRRLRATALGWIMGDLWAVEHEPWIMDHGTRLLGAPATGQGRP